MLSDKEVETLLLSLLLLRRRRSPHLLSLLLLRLNVHDAGKKNPSITRTLLRLMWFLDFVAAFLSKLGENTSASVTFVAREAYNEKLAPNHPWIVRKAASASMALCPSRDSLMKSISLNGTTPSEEQCEILISTGNEMKKTLDKLWAYYTSNEITKLK